MTGLIILASLIGISAIGSTVFLLIQSYNHMMKLRVNVDKQFANIDVLLKQRADEVPELVNIIKASANYEKDKLNALTQAYDRYQNSTEIADKLQASQAIDELMQVILASTQQPDFHGLKQRLSEIETQIAHKREAFNESVANFNALILRIPYILLAAMLNIQACQYLQISEAEKAYHGVDL